MKKIIILAIAAFMMIFAAACEKGPMEFDMSKTKTIHAANNSVSVDVPAVIYKNETDGVGKEYSASGLLKTDEVDEDQFYFHITRFFQEEDSNFTYDLFKNFVINTKDYVYTSNSTITTLYEDYSFGESAVGVINKLEYGDLDYYSAYIKGDGAYYAVSLGVYAELDEEAVLDMMKSIKIDAENEKKAVDKFELNIKNGVYYSADVRGAQIDIPDDWQVTEALNILYPNSIIGMTGDNGKSAISVQVFDKSVSGLDTADETYEFLLQYMQARELWVDEDSFKAYEVETEYGTFTFYIFLSNYIVTQCVMENASTIFVIEGIVFDGDLNKMDEIIDISSSFDAAGVQK